MGTIYVDRKYLEDLQVRLIGITADVNDGCNAAVNAELVSNPSDINTIKKNYNKMSELMYGLTEQISTIVSGFSTEDANLKSKADEVGRDLLGENIYSGVNQGGTVPVNSETGEVGVVVYPDRLNNYEGLHQYNGECTCISTAILITRYRLLYDPSYNNEYGYSYRDGDKPYNIRNAVHGGWGDNDWGPYMSEDLPDGHHYSTAGGTGSITQDQLIGLLSEHPEGVVLYCRYADGSYGHALVVTKYENGSFSAVDPANGPGTYNDSVVERNITDTHLYNGKGRFGSIDELLNNVSTYQYIESFN